MFNIFIQVSGIPYQLILSSFKVIFYLIIVNLSTTEWRSSIFKKPGCMKYIYKATTQKQQWI